jgi:hypothetical protein
MQQAWKLLFAWQYRSQGSTAGSAARLLQQLGLAGLGRAALAAGLPAAARLPGPPAAARLALAHALCLARALLQYRPHLPLPVLRLLIGLRLHPRPCICHPLTPS